MPEPWAVWININCSASWVLYYRSRLLSINHPLKGDCLGLHRFLSPSAPCFKTVTSLSKYDLFTASDLVNIDQCRMWGKFTQPFKEKYARLEDVECLNTKRSAKLNQCSVKSPSGEINSD